MAATSARKVDSHDSVTGPQGQKYLASGASVGMRLWQNEPSGELKPTDTRPYETVGYVISGSAELHVEGQILVLNTGDSWLVPANTEHTYRMLKTFTAVEATSPPAQSLEEGRAA